MFTLINFSLLGFLISFLLVFENFYDPSGKNSFISGTHSIIPAGVTKLFKLQSGDIKKLPFRPIFKLSLHATGVTKQIEMS